MVHRLNNFPEIETDHDMSGNLLISECPEFECFDNKLQQMRTKDILADRQNTC